MNLFPNVWGSVVKFSNDIILDMQPLYDAPLQFIDWETFASVPELPDVDLIGPTAFTLTESSPQMVEVTFAIAVSTYQSDMNLFRLRDYISQIFERMRPTRKFMIYNASNMQELGELIMTDGTTILPMSRSTNRPFQYVQGSGMLQPLIAS